MSHGLIAERVFCIIGIIFSGVSLIGLLILASQRIFEAIARARRKEYERCTLCEGERWIWQRIEAVAHINGPGRRKVTCPDCHGTGRTEVKHKGGNDVL